MRARLHDLAIAALASALGLLASVRPGAAEPDAPQWMDEIAKQFGADTYVAVIGNRITMLRSSRTVQLEDREVPALELWCEGRTATLIDRAAQTQDLYPVPESFCATLSLEFSRRVSGGKQ